MQFTLFMLLGSLIELDFLLSNLPTAFLRLLSKMDFQDAALESSSRPNKVDPTFQQNR